MQKKIAIIGSAGIPANYGGFETLAENLAKFTQNKPDIELLIYCSSKNYGRKKRTHLGATLIYLPLSANGLQSIFYDSWSMINAAIRKTDIILLLGVSGAYLIPLIRTISKTKIIVNVDGIEWKREKWSTLAKAYLRISEFIAAKYAHKVVADNQGVVDHIMHSYNINSYLIEYGGDHPICAPHHSSTENLPSRYALALCRIEPENNVEMILKAYSEMRCENLIFIGNWQANDYGKTLTEKYSKFSNIQLLDPIYDKQKLHTIRSKSSAYIHGHSAGGTNPSLVEIMHYAKPIFAFDCIFNRNTTNNNALYFNSHQALIGELQSVSKDQSMEIGSKMQQIAQVLYTWDRIGKLYYDLFREI